MTKRERPLNLTDLSRDVFGDPVTQDEHGVEDWPCPICGEPIMDGLCTKCGFEPDIGGQRG